MPWRDGEGWQERERERVLQNISGWLREKAFVAVCTSSHCLDVSVHATSVYQKCVK